jgi:hypothetical protein
MKYFRQAVNSGMPNDLFLASLLVPDEHRWEAAQMLMEALNRATPEGKQVVINCLRHLTGERLPMNVTAWESWWQQMKKRRAKKSD